MNADVEDSFHAEHKVCPVTAIECVRGGDCRDCGLSRGRTPHELSRDSGMAATGVTVLPYVSVVDTPDGKGIEIGIKGTF